MDCREVLYECDACVYMQLCQRRVQAHTLFYMPHCGRAMYNNLLWANWSPQDLSQLALIGNSFQSYMERSVKCCVIVSIGNGISLAEYLPRN